jgi:hypothetical protein
MRRLSRGLAAGAAGAAAMTLSTATEMRVRGRPASIAPVQAAERATGIRLPSDGARRASSWAGSVAFGTALGLVRPLLGGRPVASPAAFLLVASLPDLALVPALGAAPPPWRWGAGELAISALHHAAYAASGEATWRSLERRG